MKKSFRIVLLTILLISVFSGVKMSMGNAQEPVILTPSMPDPSEPEPTEVPPVMTEPEDVPAEENDDRKDSDPQKPAETSEPDTASTDEEQAEEEAEVEEEDILAEPIDPDKLLEAADEKVFRRKGYKEYFSEAQGYVNEIIDPNILHQYYKLQGEGHDVLMSLLPAKKTLRTGNKWLDIKNAWEDEFHVTFSLRRTENVPQGRGGGCWMKYNNTVMKGDGRESGVILYPGERVYYFYPADGETVFEPIGDLYSLNQDETIKFDFIRLNGITYFYANDRFLFSFEDGIPGNVSFSGGSILYSNGNRVHCVFDNFIMTYR